MEYTTTEIIFTGWTNGGNVLGRLPDGRVIFAANAIPGETTEVRYPVKDSRFVNGEVVRIIKESDKRIAPRCPLFGHCSLCQLQFLEYPEQLAAKTEILADHLRRIGGIASPESLMEAIIPADSPWNYRRQMLLYPDADGRLCVPDLKNDPVILEAYCPVCADTMNELLPSLDFGAESGIDVLELRLGDEDEVQLILHGQSDKPETEIENDTEMSLVYKSDEGSYVMSGVSTIRQTRGGITMAVSDSSDFPAAPGLEGKVCGVLSRLLPADPDAVLMDFNCGIGFLSKWASPRFREIHAFASDEREVEDFVYNLDELENVSLYIGPLKETIPGVPRAKTENALIEAGETGMSEEEISLLGLRNMQTVIYYGKDAAITARDTKRLCNQGYRLTKAVPLDPAPQTAEVNALLKFVR